MIGLLVKACPSAKLAKRLTGLIVSSVRITGVPSNTFHIRIILRCATPLLWGSPRWQAVRTQAPFSLVIECHACNHCFRRIPDSLVFRTALGASSHENCEMPCIC